MTLLRLYASCLAVLSEAATVGDIKKKVFLKILQNSQENICARVSFLMKMQASASSASVIYSTYFPSLCYYKNWLINHDLWLIWKKDIITFFIGKLNSDGILEQLNIATRSSDRQLSQIWSVIWKTLSTCFSNFPRPVRKKFSVDLRCTAFSTL